MGAVALFGEAPDQVQVASPGRSRAGSQGAGAGSSRGCGAPLWSEKVLTGTPGGAGGSDTACSSRVIEASMAHLSMVIADSIGRTRGRRARWCLSTYAHLSPAPISALLLGIRISSGCLNLPSGVQHHSVFASTTVTAPPRQHVHRPNPTSLANIICRFVRGSGIRNWRLSLNTAYEFQ